jgi:hypothetical protein
MDDCDLKEEIYWLGMVVIELGMKYNPTEV